MRVRKSFLANILIDLDVLRFASYKHAIIVPIVVGPIHTL